MLACAAVDNIFIWSILAMTRHMEQVPVVCTTSRPIMKNYSIVNPNESLFRKFQHTKAARMAKSLLLKRVPFSLLAHSRRKTAKIAKVMKKASTMIVS